MEYQDLRKLFHISSDSAESAYQERFNSADTVHLGFSIAGHPAFCVLNTEVYRLILQAERLNREIDAIARRLPKKAVRQYTINCLVDEIVLTNGIEGVRSSRQEIGTVLANLEKNDRTGRFRGIVEKYLALQHPETISIQSCKDIRRIYDDLVLTEVIERNSKNAPDGRIFRAGPVSVLDAEGKPIHEGITPEERLIERMDAALCVLNNDNLEILPRIALFHFLFAHAHPFYDGNGRTNRFISSCILMRHFNPLVGLRLSYSVKEQIGRYYKGFALCEHPLNQGDLTPFVLIFCEIVIAAMKSMRDSLWEKRNTLAHSNQQIADIVRADDGKASAKEDLCSFANTIAQATLFSDSGISATEAAKSLEITPPTFYQRSKFFEGKGIIGKNRIGRCVYYVMDFEALDREHRQCAPSTHVDECDTALQGMTDEQN